MSLYPVLVFATATISVSLQLNCGSNYTYKDEWQRNWCVVSHCYYDERTKSCRECSKCNRVFRLDSDGPMLQCQVEDSGHNLCAPSEITFYSFVEDKRSMPICFLASLVFTVNISFMVYVILKPYFWLQKIKKTPRYIGGGRLNRNEILKLYRPVAKKVKKIAEALSIKIVDIESIGRGQYSREEHSFRILMKLSNSETDIATIAKEFCNFGYGELLYRIFTDNSEIPEAQATPHDVMNRDVTLNLCDELYNHTDYAKYQFEIAIELRLNLSEIDNCRSVGFLSKDAMQDMFAIKNPSLMYSYQYLQQVLQRAKIPKSLLDVAVSDCPDSNHLINQN